jgi:putative ABC transport system permease protein
VGESALLTVTGVSMGIGLLYALLVVSQPLILTRFGLFIEISAISLYELWLIVIICVAGIVIGLIPGYRIYRYSLADGMTIRI